MSGEEQMVMLMMGCGLVPTVTVMDTVEVDVNWGDDAVTLLVEEGMGTFMLGVAHTDDGDLWLGEDCLAPDPVYGTDVCHVFEGDRLTLDYERDREEVLAATTTYVSDRMQFGATFGLWNQAGDCVAWGHDPDHFVSVGCDTLEGEEPDETESDEEARTF